MAPRKSRTRAQLSCWEAATVTLGRGEAGPTTAGTHVDRHAQVCRAQESHTRRRVPRLGRATEAALIGELAVKNIHVDVLAHVC